MDQVSFVDALLPAGFGRNARLERIAGLIDWAPIERLVAEIHPGETGRPPYWPLAMFKALLDLRHRFWDATNNRYERSRGELGFPNELINYFAPSARP